MGVVDQIIREFLHRDTGDVLDEVGSHFLDVSYWKGDVWKRVRCLREAVRCRYNHHGKEESKLVFHIVT